MKTMFAMFLQKRLCFFGSLAVCASAACALSAQSPAARIASQVNGSELAAIKGSQHPLANPANDEGRMPASARLSGISVSFSRSAAQEADLDALLAAQQDPASAQYHRWLTSDQFAARFGMAQADLDKVSNWLQQQGFTVDSVNRSHNAIRFSGSVSQVESAFQTQMHYYEADGARHFAPSTALSIPAAFTPVVSAVRNLNDFRPRPQHTLPRPGFSSGVSGNVFFVPQDIVTAYDIAPLYSGGVNGAGQTIAIMGQSFVSVADMAAFQTAAGLTKKAPQLVLVPGSGADGAYSAGDEGESDLDLEWSSAIAPGANVVLVYTGSNTNFGVYDSAQYAVDQMIGNIISLSYSSCETQLTASDLTTLEAIFKQGAAQGQTIMAASGDAGSTACSGSKNLTAAQQQALAVNYPASSAYVTGVGGTSMSSAEVFGGSNFSTYWSSNYNSSSKSPANDLTNSLLKYVPEVVWNDGTTQGLSSTGGGTSALVARPSWQAGVPGIPAGTFRLVPDIAFYSSPGLPGYLYCTSDTSSWAPASGGSPAQSGSCGSGFRASSSDSSLTIAGGTSFATPIFAGMVALLNQKLNYTEGQGQVNPALYTLAANAANYSSAAIHDITSGNNNCNAGSTICGTTTGGFSAGTGYDEVTGIGSLDLAKIAAVWPTNSNSNAALIPTTTSVSTPATPDLNANVTFAITVSGSTPPTGTVTLQIDGGTAWGTGGTTVSGQAIVNGLLNYSTAFSKPGPHQVLAQYSGDATHVPSVGSAQISIPLPVAVTATSVSVSQGSQASSTITLTPSKGYTGTVNLTFTTSNNTALQNLCYSFTTMSGGTGTAAIPGATAVTTQLTLDTKASDCAKAAAVTATGKRSLGTPGAKGHALRNDTPRPGSRSLPAGIAFAGFLVAGFLLRGSRRLRNMACILALGAIGMAVTACGGGGGGNNGGGGTTSVPNPAKGTYTITLTTTDSTTFATTASPTTITLTIN